MKNQSKIIEQFKEIIKHLKKRIDGQYDPLFWTKLQKMESRLESLQSEQPEIRSTESTDECPNYNICEDCGKKYYHNRPYHLASEKLLCPDCYVKSHNYQ
jgi:hypothetical protein